MAPAEVYRTPEERFESLPEFPFAPRYAMFDGLRLHYLDEGRGQTCLLLHGEPTWSFLYRKLIPGLRSAGLRAVAPDLPGFGRSDKWTSPAAYSFAGHVRALRELVRSLDLRNLVLVVHDWGGPIGLRLAVLEPERIARLVVLNTGLFTAHVPLPETLRRWREYVLRHPDLDVGRTVARGCARPVAPEVQAAYDAPFPTRDAKAGALAFPLLIPESRDEPGAKEMRETVQELDKRAWPTLVLWSDRDPIFPVGYGRYVTGLFAGSDLNVIEGAGHFLQEDAGPEIAKRIVEFLRSGW